MFGIIDYLVGYVIEFYIYNSILLWYVCCWKDCFRNGFLFKECYRLVNYLWVYIGEKFFMCMYFGCGRWFLCVENLKIYKRIYIGEKLFLCIFFDCGCCFGNLSDRKKYLYVYILDRFFLCWLKECKKCFSEVNLLRKYMKLYEERGYVF